MTRKTATWPPPPGPYEAHARVVASALSHARRARRVSLLCSIVVGSNTALALLLLAAGVIHL